MKLCSTPSLRRLSAVLFALAAAGCVSQGAYDTVVAERDGLEEQRARLAVELEKAQASTASLAAERVQLIDEMEDLRMEQATLSTDVEQLRRAHAQLSEDLATREAELAQRSETLDELSGTYEGLVADLEAEVAAGQIQIEHLREGLRLNLSQEILFPSGSAQLNAGGVEVLRAVAARLESLPNTVEVQGHTDNIPLNAQAMYPSNWELAAARAANVVRLFVDSGMKPERFTVVSFGEYAPIADNATPEGRAQNRRIEIRLKPTPGAAAAAPSEAPGTP